MADSRTHKEENETSVTSGPMDAPRAARLPQGIASPRKQGRFLIVEPPKTEYDDDLTDSSVSPSSSPVSYSNLAEVSAQSRLGKPMPYEVDSKGTDYRSSPSRRANGGPSFGGDTHRPEGAVAGASASDHTPSSPSATRQPYSMAKRGASASVGAQGATKARRRFSSDSSTSSSSCSESTTPSYCSDTPSVPTGTGFLVKNRDGPLFDPSMAAVLGWTEEDSSTSDMGEPEPAAESRMRSESHGNDRQHINRGVAPLASGTALAAANSSSLAGSQINVAHSNAQMSSLSPTSSSSSYTSTSTTVSAASSTPAPHTSTTLLPPMSAYGSGQVSTKERERMRREWLANIVAHKTEQDRIAAEKEKAIIERKRMLEQRAAEAAEAAEEAAAALAAAAEAVASAQAQARALLIAREQVTPVDFSRPTISSATFVDPASTRNANSAAILAPLHYTSTSPTTSPRVNNKSPPHSPLVRASTSVESRKSPSKHHILDQAPKASASASSVQSSSHSPSAPSSPSSTGGNAAATKALELPVLDLATYQNKRLSSDPHNTPRAGLSGLPPPTPHAQSSIATSPRNEMVTSPTSTSADSGNGQPPTNAASPIPTSVMEPERRAGHRRSASDITLEVRMHQLRRDSGPPPRPAENDSRKNTLEMTVSSSSLSDAGAAPGDSVELSSSSNSIQRAGTSSAGGGGGAASPTTPKRVRIQERPASEKTTRGRSSSVSKRIGNFIGRIFESKSKDEKEKDKEEKKEKIAKKNSKKRMSSSGIPSSSSTGSHPTTVRHHTIQGSSLGEESLDSSHGSHTPHQNRGTSPTRSASSIVSSNSSESIGLARSADTAGGMLGAPELSASPPEASPSLVIHPGTPPKPIELSSSPSNTNNESEIKHAESGSSASAASSSTAADPARPARPRPPVPPKPHVVLRSQTLRPSTTTKKEFGLDTI